MTQYLKQMGAQLKTILDSGPRGSTERPECRSLTEQMSGVALNPKTYQSEIQGQQNQEQLANQQKLITLSYDFFSKRCDQWIGESGARGLATTTLGVARNFLATASLIPGFHLPILAVGTLTDLLFSTLERLFKARSIQEQLSDHEKLLDQQALLCAYFEHVTQVDETLTDDVLTQMRKKAQDELTQKQKKVQELELSLNACNPLTRAPMIGGTDWESWRKIHGKLQGETQAERYFSLLERIQSAEWNGEIARALQKVCSPDDNPNPTEQQKALCFYHKKLVDLLAAPTRDQAATLDAYSNLIAGISAARIFGATEFETLQAQLTTERAAIEKLRADALGLSDNDEVRRSSIFDRIRLRGREMLIGTSAQKGVLRTHLQTLEESIERSLKQVPMGDLLKRLKKDKNSLRCEEVKSIRQPLTAAVAHARLIQKVCSRFAGDRTPRFRDQSLKFTRTDPRLEEHCDDAVESAQKSLSGQPSELYDTLLRELPECTADWNQ
jgi:hypothetical protein